MKFCRSVFFIVLIMISLASCQLLGGLDGGTESESSAVMSESQSENGKEEMGSDETVEATGESRVDESVCGDAEDSEKTEESAIVTSEKLTEIETNAFTEAVTETETLSETVTETETETATETETETETECAHQRFEEVQFIAPTCQNGGILHVVCSDCGELLMVGEDEPLSHTEGDWIIDKAAGYGVEGKRHTNCTVCGERIDGVIEAKPYSEGLVFVSNGDGTCTLVSGADCTDEDVKLPAVSPDGDIVTAIGDGAFASNTVMKKVNIPSNIVSIGARAFEGCTLIQRIWLPATTESIGEYAFSGCSSLTKVSMASKVALPDALKEIGSYAFSGCALVNVRLSASLESLAEGVFFDCASLESVVFNEKCTSIGNDAFSGCSSLYDVILPEGIISIGDRAFMGCSSLEMIDIPAATQSMGNSVFAYCESLISISVNGGNASYYSSNNCIIDKATLTLIAGCNSSSIPSEVLVIGEAAFAGAKGLKKVVIPSGVIHISQDVFNGCSALESLVISGGIEGIGINAFLGCDALNSIKYYGDEESWAGILIAEGNDALLGADIDFVEGVAPETVRGYGRTTISGNAAYVYDILEASMLKEIPDSTINLDKNREVSLDDFSVARMIFLSDHPECFWWGGTAVYSINEDGYIYYITPSYLYQGETLKTMRARLDAVVEEIVAGVPEGTVFEKALYLHDKVAEIVTYKFTDNDQTPYGALVEGEAVCNGYATSYQLLLMECGIRAWTVNGTSKGIGHAWNVVWLDDETCVYTDVTWDDQESVTLRYYFNMSLDEIDDDHTISEFFTLPECNHTNEGYYEVASGYNSLSALQGADVIVSFLEEREDGVRVAHFYYSGSDFKAWLEQHSSDLYKKVGGGSISYSVFGKEVVLYVK